MSNSKLSAHYCEFIKQLQHRKLHELLTVISSHYPTEFKSQYIKNELAYLEQHIIYTPITTIKASKNIPQNTTKPKKNKKPISAEQRCNARVYGPIYDKGKKPIIPVEKISAEFRIIDFKDIKCDRFNEKYQCGNRCANKHRQDSTYCGLHAKHLIHGDFNIPPSAELIYHFIRENKLLC